MSGFGRSNPVVILDRDGTIVIDRGYLSDPDGLEFLPGAAEGLARLYGEDFRLIVITNQSGVGRGLFSLEALLRMNARLSGMVESVGARLEGIYCCPHLPETSCECRKPELGLMTQAAKELEFDPQSSIVIGDRISDIEFGHRAGARTVLISADPRRETPGFAPDLIAADLTEAAEAICRLSRRL